MAIYPDEIYDPRVKENAPGIVYDQAKSTVIFAEDISKNDAETIAIQTELGTNPKGAYASVKAWLQMLFFNNVSAADKILGRVTAGAGVVEEIACTAAGRALIDDADASAQRSTLGLGTIATQASDNVSITGGSVIGQTGIKIGTVNTPSNKDTTVPIFVVGGNSVAATAQIVRHTNPGGGGAIFKLSATRGADVNDYTIVNNGDGLGTFSFAGADGDEFVVAAQVSAAVDGTPGDNDMPGRLVFATTADGAASPAERMRIDSAGGIRMTAYGAGAATFDASGNITSVSDERLKIIQGDFPEGLPEILQINPIRYKYNELSGLEMENTYAGFSAQNVMGYIPEAVGKDPRGYYTFNDRPIVAALVNAVKTLAVRCAALEAKLKMEVTTTAAIPITGENKIIKSRVAVEVEDKIADY